jgi:hypothetical protein
MIAKNDTFPFKRKEIRGKLTRGLLSNVEEYKTTVEGEEFVDDMEDFREKLKVGLINAKKRGKPQDGDFKKYMREIPTAVWRVTSELIFAGISNDAEYKICFDTPDKGHDYDFVVNDIPCQVKTIILEQKNQQEVVQEIISRKDKLGNGKKVEEEEVKKGNT